MRNTFAIVIVLLIPFVAQAQLWAEHSIDGQFTGATDVFYGDIDGDGDIDMVGSSSGLDQMAWWENVQGNGYVWEKHVVNGSFDGAWGVHANDIDNDGDTDIVGAAHIADNITWWENVNGDGLSWTSHIVATNVNSAYSVISVDFDNDGDFDIAATSEQDDNIKCWINTNGIGTDWDQYYVVQSFDSPNDIFSADINGDGSMDILATSENDNTIAWWSNVAGNGTAWSQYTVSNSLQIARGVYAADVDNDGDNDILGAGHYAFIVWENVDGFGSQWNQEIIDDGNITLGHDIAAYDINDTGSMEIFGAYGSRINLYGNGEAICMGFDGIRNICLLDVDNDSDIDLISSAYTENAISWFEQPGPHITVTTPNGSEEWEINSIEAIEWNSDSQSDVRIRLYENTNWYENIILETENDGIYEWSIPEYIEPDNDYRIRIELLDTDEFDQSDDFFSIVESQVITIMVPSGDETWLRGNSYTILWTDNIQEHVSIELYQNMQLAEIVTQNTDSDGSFDWDIPVDGLTGDNFTIKITSLIDPGIFAESNPFSIENTLPPLIDLALSAIDPLIVPRGSLFEYSVTITSNLPEPEHIDIWTLALTPGGTLVGPLWIINNFPILPGGTISADGIWQEVPVNVPLGTYTYGMRVGDYPDVIVAEDSFTFEVVQQIVTSTNIEHWIGGGYESLIEFAEAGTVYDVDTLPKEYTIRTAYPNPFNPTTTITVALPEAADLTVVVYNLIGKRVAELASGRFNAGNHNLTFDATGIASGLYFVRATVPSV